MRKSSRLAAIMASVVLFTACSSVPLDDRKSAPIEDRTGQRAGNAGGANSSAIDPRAVTTVDTTTSQSTGPEQQGLLAQRVILFDLDSYVVRDEFQPVMEAHANHLRSNRSRRVILQGHTDDRGSREYNLALGQKRAEAVRKALSLRGVSDDQMEAISFGEEKPSAPGSDEAAWAENRRTEIIY